MSQVITSVGAGGEASLAESRAILREVADGNREMEARNRELEARNKDLQEWQERFREAMEADRRARTEDHRRTEESLRALSAESRKTDEALRALSEETRKTEKQLRETDRQLRRTDRRFNSQWGKLVESLVEGDLLRLLQQRGVRVTEVFARRHPLGDARRRELDILAWNGADVVAVEVKSTLLVKHVRRFEETMGDVPALLPLKGALRYYGAVAYLRADQESEIYAERRGFFVIRATGSSASITNAEGFRPRDFSNPLQSGT